MQKSNIVFGGFAAAAALTLLYAVEGYIVGIFSGAPSLPLQRLLGSYWYLWFIGANIVIGLVLAATYPFLSRGLSGTHGKRGMKFGALVWALATAFYPPLLYANVNLPLWLIGGWVLGSLVNLLVLGYIIGLLVEGRE